MLLADFGAFIAVDDHPKLCAPITQVIVADDLMAQEFKRAVQTVADDRATNVADVHGLGHVGGAVIDNERARLLHERHADAGISNRRGRLLGNTLVAQAQVDESWPSDFRWLAKIVNLQARDNFPGHLPRRLAECLPKGMAQLAW